MTLSAVVLAAGAGSRFGGAVKPLHRVEGVPMVERVLAVLASAGPAERVVVLGAHAEEILAAADLHGARPVVAERWADGQAASLRAGLAAVTGDAAMVCLGDGPALDPRAVTRLWDAWTADPGSVHAAEYGAGRSHPVVLPRAVWPELPATGETPARELPARPVDCRDLPAPGDVDYPGG